MNLVSYIRVSRVGGREGDSFQSPREQRRAIQSIVALTPNAQIVREIEDLDESGGTMDRPGVREAIAAVEDGHADGIVCAYLDRWARTVEALEMIERWAKQGRTFISARERFDPTTSHGKFALGMMLLVAKYYRDLVTERWEDSTRNAIERGVHVSVPYGYRRGHGNGKPHPTGGTRGAPLVVHEPEAAVVRRIFSERASGEGISAIERRLNEEGVLSPRGGRWTRQAVRALLRVRTYTGVAHRGGHEMPDAHESVVSVGEWEAAQTARGVHRGTGNSVLSGLVRCAGCGYVMGAGSSTHGGRRYNCGRSHSEMRCPSPTTAPADTLERIVTEQFFARYGGLKMSGASTHDPLVAESEAKLDATRAEYERWRDDGEMRAAIGDDDYRAGLLARKATVDDAERAYGDAVRASKSDALHIDAGIWPDLSVAEQREVFGAGLDAVVVTRATSTHAVLAERVEVLWTGELEHDGTRSGIAAAVRERLLQGNPGRAGMLAGQDAG